MMSKSAAASPIVISTRCFFIAHTLAATAPGDDGDATVVSDTGGYDTQVDSAGHADSAAFDSADDHVSTGPDHPSNAPTAATDSGSADGKTVRVSSPQCIVRLDTPLRLGSRKTTQVRCRRRWFPRHTGTNPPAFEPFGSQHPTSRSSTRAARSVVARPRISAKPTACAVIAATRTIWSSNRSSWSEHQSSEPRSGDGAIA